MQAAESKQLVIVVPLDPVHPGHADTLLRVATLTLRTMAAATPLGEVLMLQLLVVVDPLQKPRGSRRTCTLVTDTQGCVHAPDLANDAVLHQDLWCKPASHQGLYVRHALQGLSVPHDALHPAPHVGSLPAPLAGLPPQFADHPPLLIASRHVYRHVPLFTLHTVLPPTQPAVLRAVPQCIRLLALYPWYPHPHTPQWYQHQHTLQLFRW